jgi:hypothetical protein
MVATKQKATSRKIPEASAGLMISNQVQLTSVRLINCKCEQKPAAVKGKRLYNITTSTEASPDRGESRLAVITNFQLEAFLEGNNRKPVLIIEVAFLLSYEVRDFDGLTEEGFRQFAASNGVFNAWPYWREFVQNTVGRMGLPPLTIPVFRITPRDGSQKTKGKTKR